MGARERTAAMLDSLVGLFSPKAESQRRFYRQRLDLAKRFAGASLAEHMAGWNPAEKNFNDLVASASPVLRARVAALVRDFPAFTRASNVLVNFTVGTGIPFQSRVRESGSPANSKKKPSFDHKINGLIEDGFKRWMDEAHAGGQLHFHELQRLAKRQDGEAGEYFFVKVRLPERGRYLPFALQPFEANWLTETGARPQGKNKVHQGVEYEPTTGRPVAYHFEDPDSWGKPKRILARDVIHGFKTLVPGQMRGVSPFAPAIMLARSLGSYIQSEINVAEMASRWLGTIHSDDPVSYQKQRTTTDPTTKVKTEVINGVILEYMDNGSKIEFANPQRPTGNLEPASKLILRLIAVCLDVPYELISGDYSGYSYSGLRGARNDLLQMFRPKQARLVRQLCNPVFVEFLDWTQLAGRFTLPGYWQDPWRYRQPHWFPPTIESVDLLRDAKGYAALIKLGAATPQQFSAMRGFDFEQNLDDIEEAVAMAEMRDLTLGEVGAALASNPAAQEKKSA